MNFKDLYNVNSNNIISSQFSGKNTNNNYEESNLDIQKNNNMNYNEININRNIVIEEA